MSADGDLLGPPGLVFGTMFGIVAFLFGLLVTSLVFRPDSIEVVSGSEVGEWRKTIWYYFDAQFVDITTRLGGRGSGMDIGAVDSLVGTGLDSIPVRLVAPITVFLAGIVTVAYAGTSSTVVLSGMTGAMSVLGYVVAAGGAALASTYQSGQPFGVVIGPNYVYVLVVSIVLGVVFGGLGGIAYHLYREYQTPDSVDVDLY